MPTAEKNGLSLSLFSLCQGPCWLLWILVWLQPPRKSSWNQFSGLYTAFGWRGRQGRYRWDTLIKLCGKLPRDRRTEQDALGSWNRSKGHARWCHPQAADRWVGQGVWPGKTILSIWRILSQSVPRSWSWRGLMKAWSCWQTISVGRWSRLWLVCCLTRWPLSFILGPLYKAMF